MWRGLTRLTSASLGVLAALAIAGAGCASSPAAGARDPSRPLPTYVGHATELFDDVIEPSAVGLELDGPGAPPRSNALLRERTQTGDAVLHVRVETVTGKDDGVDARYDLGFKVLERLAGQHPPPESFMVRVDKTSPSAPILKSFQARLSGKTFVAFVKEFVRSDGDTDYHFHLATDDKATILAVKEAGVLGELK
ncbi:MAG: hypothetical protein JWM74_1043 [Myxococcaceae bacterium]|jgi:hypothetical protein|nr:hypothetical protein [Myxococcaceae bacterium]